MRTLLNENDVEMTQGYVLVVLKYYEDIHRWDVEKVGEVYENLSDVFTFFHTGFDEILYPVWGCEGFIRPSGRKDGYVGDITRENVIGNPLAVFVYRYTDGDFNISKTYGVYPWCRSDSFQEVLGLAY